MLGALYQNSPKFFHLQPAKGDAFAASWYFMDPLAVDCLYTHTCTQAQMSPSCHFWLSSVHFHPTTPSFPPSLLSSPPLVLLLVHLATLIVGDGSKSCKIFFFLFFVDSQRGSETGARIWLQLLIKNRHWPVCHEVRNLSQPLCGRCRDPYEDILYCQLWNKQKKKKGRWKKIHSLSTAFSQTWCNLFVNKILKQKGQINVHNPLK